ncbi:uncharacterized protein LOC106644568 [Copidosoma floridanum]|uniref:uncharacterized protein LOC106644568 n=1 Tax=Copidosoma floridanum TaxID=29053 RepID=UPI0006C96B72|nr:uncharacterized protein LOC106644568 [Copidosoma floridanum]
MDNQVDENDEDILQIASKTSSKAIKSVAKTGYREGVQDGSESVFQEGFDRGYKQAFPSTFKLGVYYGLANSLLKGVKHPTEIKDILCSAKKGICYVCKTEIDKISENPLMSIDTVVTCQKEHEDKVLKTLFDYFDPLFKNHNICYDLSSLQS